MKTTKVTIKCTKNVYCWVFWTVTSGVSVGGGGVIGSPVISHEGAASAVMEDPMIGTPLIVGELNRLFICLAVLQVSSCSLSG